MRKFMILYKSDKSTEDQPRYDLHSTIEARNPEEACEIFENGNTNDGTVIVVEVVAESVSVLQLVE